VERRWSGAGRRLVVPVAMAAITALAAVSSWSAVDAEPPHAGPSAESRSLVRQLVRALPEGQGDVLVRYSDPQSGWYAHTVLNELERRGVEAKVSRDPGRQFGPARVRREGDPLRAVLTVAVNDQYDRLAARPPGRLVAYVSELPPGDRARAAAVIRRQLEDIEARVAAGELDLDQAAEEQRRVGGVGSATAVFLEAP
jgi:hypothetical protein